MSADEFNMLSENIENVDFLVPVLVVPVENGRFRIVDGEHRYEAQRIRDVQTIKCVMADPERFDENTQKFQTVRMNKIKGTLNQKKFNALVSSLMESGEFTYDALAHEFGFVNEDEFTNLLENTRESLPTPEMQNAFDEAKDDIKTVDDLSALLNNLFTKFGDTLPFNFMILDFGGKDHIWVRMSPKVRTGILQQARNCMAEGVTFDSVITHTILNMDIPAFVNKFRDRLEVPEENTGESIDDIMD